MMSRIGAIAIAVALVSPIAAASAQTALTESQIIQSLSSAGSAPSAQPLTADLIKQAVQQHMADNPGMPITWKPLQLVAALPQIDVQIQFALNSAIIRPESYQTIGSIADALHHPLLLGYKFVVAGNTDTTGNRQDNLALSQARADAVVSALVTTYNVDPNRVEAVGLGEESLETPKDPTNPINRRVQVFTIGKYLPGK
ncbi:outer membrane protein OmpA-like peptidoglycan-associated protein [Kaistia hirudinis]|uniref:Outer membrane protein OmpA-like peptidoglycan-associated protein n=1 Tax=Kaistia hirudinis TaxID=1293440 RepID=A0A840ANW4_9HYPH|nr:OmpA family protein [Kaistia hirudinis]MBB3931979.1 outer membrane protein OmpA-like peptidoglycan-associated protein [Kaistia hirudinis]